jgi:predicted nucleotidyltransferase
METHLRQALREAVAFLDSQGYRYAVIGGIANQIWGQARFTYDIDLKVLVPNFEYDTVRATVNETFPEPGRPDLPFNPLIVSAKIGEVIVDFLLITPGYEEQIITRAIRYALDDLSIWVCSAEDLIIQKAIAGRVRDWQDLEGILIEQYAQLDQRYLEDWLTQFAEALEQPDILSQYRQIWKRVTIANHSSTEQRT